MYKLEIKVLRKIFGPRRDDQTSEWRRLHNIELHDLYGKPDIVSQTAMGRACDTNGK